MKVRIQNFQSIKDISFEIESLTAVYGANNLGKSSLWRAIVYALTNQQGTDFVRKGSKYCEITIWYEGREIIWKKGKDTNQYIIDGVLKDKVGRGLPPKEILDLNFIQIGTGSAAITPNFAKQFDRPFLINEQPSVVNDVLNKVSRSDRIASGLKQCTGDLRQNQSIKGIRENDIEVEVKFIKELEKLDYNIEISKLGSHENNIKSLAGEESTITNFRNKLSLCSSRIDFIPKIELKSFYNYERDLNSVGKMYELSSILNKLEVLKRRPQIRINLDPLKDFFDKFKRILEASKKFKKISFVLSKIKLPVISSLPIINLWKSLSDWKIKIDSLNNEVEDNKIELEGAIVKLHSVAESFKLFVQENPRCPLCGGNIQLENIING